MKFLEKGERWLGRLGEDRFYLVLLSVLAAAVAGAMTVFVLGLHRNFLTIACDTATFQNVIVNTLDGRWFRDTAYNGPNLLGLHSVLALALVAPVYAIFPSPDTLFILQIWGIYSAVIPLYLVAVEMTQRRPMSFLVALSALASPLFLHMAAAPYHPESWIIAAVLWSYYFYRRNRPVGFWIALGVAVTSGEQAGPIYIALGAALLLFDDGLAWRRRYGKYTLTAGLAWMVLAVGLLAPLMHVPGQQNLIAYHYSQWKSGSAGGLALALAQNPAGALGTLLSPARWLHLFLFVGLPLAAAFLSRRSLILLLPFPVFFLMCDQEFYLSFHAYYYQFAFFAGYFGLLLFLARWDIASRLGGMVLTFVFFLNILIFCSALGGYQLLNAGRDDEFSSVLRRAFAGIPREAGVYGPHRYSAYLSNRDNMVMGDLRDENLDFNAMIESRYLLTDVHAGQIDYIVCDLQNDQCGWRRSGFDPTTAQRRADNLKKLVQSGQWQLCWNQNDVVILKRTPGAAGTP
jgi:uncharacterized membrane protein